jgi:hypothetical protein
MVLCVKCYTEKNFPDTLSEKDFEKLDLLGRFDSLDTLKESSSQWKTEDTLKLLDLIEKYGDNWEEILK